jgi:hypothetical protein
VVAVVAITIDGNDRFAYLESTDKLSRLLQFIGMDRSAPLGNIAKADRADRRS